MTTATDVSIGTDLSAREGEYASRPGTERRPSRHRPSIDLGVVLLGLASVAMIVVGIFATRYGLVYYPDAAIYLGVAHNLLHGHGLTSPIGLSFTDTFS